ncbi:response regulator transcription factor [Solirubrobacter sp. CPCC 204708]|uniref:Response regulator transcription factor n=1 Tax=Solirubrobacter deserti TaxID=2282478 RepID=A0ABT4RDN4_9ACTN|nr:response regulator transcription factor [Solirubrobacter deserti]MBE2314642.1 response regulator transcription factor [Solirubrobacter deserti]MDA0136649.1 response regulator transcription factor [Solirubrobacter deserti]
MHDEPRDEHVDGESEREHRSECADDQRDPADATGYLLKDAEPEEVVRAVRAAAAGDAPLDPRAAREVLSAQREMPPDLTEREREILGLVAAGHANKVIALRLGISHKTVRNTLSGACRKIGATDRTQAALWAQRSGLA